MIINKINGELSGDLEKQAWHGLNRFRNTTFTAKTIIDIHHVPQKHFANVKKQSEQIRQCIIQASEYFSAAKSVSLATRPLLLYYGTMSLALAEVLMKGTGNSSLDRARGEHAHHGLVLKIDKNPSSEPELKDSGLALRAEPLVKEKGQRSGTFHLWWELSRESPICGVATNNHISFTESKNEILMSSADEQFDQLPAKGMTLLKCFQNTPYMHGVLSNYGISSELVRAKAEGEYNNINKSGKLKITIHHGESAVIQNAMEKIKFHPNDFENLTITPANVGCFIHTNFGANFPNTGGPFPNSYQWFNDEFLLCSDNNILNEFGVYYLGSYILGNYARYFPDQWIIDVETSSALSLCSAHFLDQLQFRAPLLSYFELLRSVMLMRR